MHAIEKYLRALVLLATFVAAFAAARTSSAHELAIDQLRLFPDASGHVRGQVLFDPKLTRENNDAGFDAIARSVVAFLRSNLALEADGRRVELSFEVREIWNGDGAIGGDSVMLDAVMPRGATTLRVFAGKPFRALAVTIEAAGAGGGASPESTLLLGGETTPPYRFAAPGKNQGWAEGDPELLAQKLEPHRDTSGAAAPAVASPGAKAPNLAPSSGFAAESVWSTAARFVKLGFTHILPHGWDHVLFVAGLVLGSRKKLRAMLAQLGAFTVAHTVTLALGALGLVVLPGHVVEPLIAFSIAFVAVENLVKKGEPRYRAAWAFGFGLLHGQGFAGALAETGLPRDSFLTALFSFNFGVELGQLAVVALLLLVLHSLREPDRFYRYAVRPGSIAIALVGLYWGVERLVA